MSEKEIQNIIIDYLKVFDPEYIGLFGSFVRNDFSGKSDIDILVKFREGKSLLQLIRMENDLGKKIGKKIDLVTEGALKNERIVNSIQNDLKIIYRA